MITKEQIQLAKKAWEDARDSAALAHQSWATIIESRNALLKIIRTESLKKSAITQEFERLTKDHAEKYKSALDHMENMAQIHDKLIDKLERACL